MKNEDSINTAVASDTCCKRNVWAAYTHKM